MKNLPEPCRSEPVGESLVVRFYDLGNRYYGDYHRIKILARIEVPLREEYFRDAQDSRKALEKARRQLGDVVVFEKSLEKMGVSGGDVDPQKTALIDGYLRTATAYLANPDFPRRLIEQRLRDQKKHPFAMSGR